MSESSTSGGFTPPYPSPSFQATDQGGTRNTSATPTSDTEGNDVSPAGPANAGISNYYAGGNSRISLSNATSPLLPAMAHGTDYTYAMDPRDTIHTLSNSNSLSSVAFEDSQKHSYHPIGFMMAGASAGNLAESLESGRLLHNTSESSPISGLGMTSLGHLSTRQNSFEAPPEQAPSSLLPRPITYGLGPLDNPSNNTKLYEPHVSSVSGDSFNPAALSTTPPSGVYTTQVSAGANAPPAATAFSDSLPSIHGSVFFDAPKQLLPKIRSKSSMASTITLVDKSPLDPSMTARGATPNRSLAPSLNVSRFPIVPSPSSSVDTHRSTTPTPFSEVPRGTDRVGGATAFPTQRLPNPPERPPSHLLLDAGLADSGRNASDFVGVQSSVHSAPTVAMLSNPPSSLQSATYQIPLALLAERGSSSDNAAKCSPSALVPVAAAAPFPSPPRSSSSTTSSTVAARNDHHSDNEGKISSPPDASSVRTESSRPVAPPVAGVQSLSAHPIEHPLAHPMHLQRVNVAPSFSKRDLSTLSAHSPVSLSSSSSSSSSPNCASQQPQMHELPAVSSSTPPPPPLAAIATSTITTELTRFAPLIQQTDYHKSDIKSIACTSAFTMGDVASTTVKLRLLRHKLLGRAEPLQTIQATAINAGRVRWLKGTPANHDNSRNGVSKVAADEKCFTPSRPPPRVIDLNDFRDTLVVFDNVLLAMSFALWGTVAHYNELVCGLLSYCAADVTRLKCRKDRKDVQKGGGSCVGKGIAKGEATSFAVTKSRLNAPFSSVLRFLNHCGVDVLVMTSNRKAASSFCAKRRQVRQRMRRDSDARADLHGELPVEQQREQSQQSRLSATPTTPEALHRVFIALSYDDKHDLWCPLTISRPIRQIAAAWHEERKCARRQARQIKRRQQRCNDAAAADKAKKAAAQAKLDAWQQRVNAFCQVEECTYAAAVSPRAVGATHSANSGEATVTGQHAAVVVVPNNVDTITDESSAPAMKSGNKLPFANMLYPNLVQTDVSFNLMLRQGIHPLFGVARLRLMVGLPLGIVTFLFGLAFIIYVTNTTVVCFFDSVTQQCVSANSILNTTSTAINSSGSRSNGIGDGASCFTSLSGRVLEGFDSRLSVRFLYGRPVSPGNCLIVTLCCVFAAVVATALIAYFAARYLALGGIRPCFHYVLQGVQFLLGTITCAFAAYILFCFYARRHTMQCSALTATDATLCRARLSSCGARYSYEAHTRLSGPNVALALATVYLVLCVLHWLTSLLPVVPSAVQQDIIPTATPDTYAFRPSYFAPDGPTPNEIRQLRDVMQAPLRHDLAQCVQQQDRLLTASITIGEMMQANRMQSLRRMKLNEQGRLRRTRPFANQRKDKDGGARGGRGVERKRHRYLVWSDEEKQDAFNSGSDSDSTESDVSAVAAATRDRKIVLAPRLVQRVDEIGAKVRGRALKQQEQQMQQPQWSNPFLAAAVSGASTVEDTNTAAPQKNTTVHLTPFFSSFRRKPSSSRKVVVVAEGSEEDNGNLDSNSIQSNSEDGTAVRATDSASVSLTTKNTLPMHAGTFATILPENTLPPPQQEQQSSSHDSATRPAVSARPNTSLQSHHPSQLARQPSANYSARQSVASPSVEHIIDHIVARLRGGAQ